MSAGESINAMELVLAKEAMRKVGLEKGRDAYGRRGERNHG